mmetsp:Transcript_5824/g.13759  ORF Transcript_5824/g.13759 Transcript_5824/m.13759 type:complete len:278 (-) Transcript_5824:691-1524(-)
MPKRAMSNCELSTPPTVPSGFASATAIRPGFPGKLAKAVGSRGTTPLLLHTMPLAETQWKLLFPVTTRRCVSSESSHPIPTTSSLSSTGSPRASPVSSDSRRTQSSTAATQTSVRPPHSSECDKTWFTVLPINTCRSGWPGAVIATDPSGPPRTSVPVFMSHVRQVRGPCVPSTVTARERLPPGATSQMRRRPSRQTEMIRPATGHTTPTCMSCRTPLPMRASEAWEPASQSQIRTFRSPPAVTTREESGAHAVAQMLPEMPSGFANSLMNSPSLPP